MPASQHHPTTALPPPPPPPPPQVIRSRDRLLDQLYNYLMSLKPYEIDNLLAEDPTLVKRCVAVAVAGCRHCFQHRQSEPSLARFCRVLPGPGSTGRPGKVVLACQNKHD